MIKDIFAFIQKNPLILIPIVLLIIILFVALPLIGKLRRKHRKTKETRNIVKDLMVWRRLSELVQGGKKQDKAKKELSTEIIRIEGLLKKSFAEAVSNRRTLYSVPWYTLLGEPRSGKSSLLRENELDFIPSETGEPEENDDGKASIPVRLWNGAKAVICDVSGRVFFDRWLEGSSAEWRFIIQYIRKKRGRHPLDGVILTIPADALLADNEAITHKKAILMANELGALLEGCSMYLPCYVVITKLDLVDGFREYMAEVKGDLQHQTFGYKSEENVYDEAGFDVFWTELMEKLRASGRKQILSRTVEADRVETAGKIFAFPENFNDMREKLEIYLSALFGENSFHGSKNALFFGVFWTSALSKSVALNPRMANLAGKKPDDLVLGGGKETVARSFFTRNFFNRWIFESQGQAVFTTSLRILRSLPRYAAYAALIAVGIIWLSTAVVEIDRSTLFNGRLRQASDYYNWLAAELNAEPPFHSPLIEQNSEGAFFMASDMPYENNALFTRSELYGDAYAYRNIDFGVPFGFWLPSVLLAPYMFNMRHSERTYIVNQLHGFMIRNPLLRGIESKFIAERKILPPMNKELREAIYTFKQLDMVKNKNMSKLFASKGFNESIFINYLLPNISERQFSLLNSYTKGLDHRYPYYMEEGFLYSDRFNEAWKGGLEIMINSWINDNAYPDSLYGRLENMILAMEAIATNHNEITASLSRINNLSAYTDVQLEVYRWKNLMGRRKELTENVRKNFQETLKEAGAMSSLLESYFNQDADPLEENLVGILFSDQFLNFTLNDYKELFDKDMKFLLSVQNSIPALSSRISVLKEYFAHNIRGRADVLRVRAATLKDNPLFNAKIDGKNPASESFFTVAERLLNLTDSINIPKRDAEGQMDFNPEIPYEENAISEAVERYDEYVKTLAGNDKITQLAADGRVMLLASALVNRFTVFNTRLSFIFSSQTNIEAVVKLKSPGKSFFDDSVSSIGGVSFNQIYDPRVVNEILKEIASFSQLIKQGADTKSPPLFLLNIDPSFYEPQAFTDYLNNYMAYWGAFTDNAYMPVYRWSEFQYRAVHYNAARINAALFALYKKCYGVLDGISDLILAGDLKNEKARNINHINDKMTLLSHFNNDKADRMLLVWGNLPANAQKAYTQIENIPENIRNTEYMAMYNADKSASLGWWNDFTMNGVRTLTYAIGQNLLGEFTQRAKTFRAFPLVADAPANNALSPETVAQAASLVGALGMRGRSDPAGTASPQVNLLPVLFQGYIAQKWAETVYKFAAAASDESKPLTWTISQPPFDISETLNTGGRLLASHRFRYVEVSSGGRPPKTFNTAGSSQTTLLQGNARESGLSFKFFVSSEDDSPSAEFAWNNNWAIFHLYLAKNTAADSSGNSYIPLHFEDSTGKYVYFLRISFNAELPPPEDWYTESTWPNFSTAQGMITGN